MRTKLTALAFLLAAGLAAAGRAAGATLARDVAFLTAHAPARDLPLPGDFVTNNCLLAAGRRPSKAIRTKSISTTSCPTA